jgi:uncharacterized protein YndB with AHSA1/START domain
MNDMIKSMNIEPIQVSILVKKPLVDVWAHLTNPNSIKNWNHASDDWETTKVTIDFRVGGRFLYHMAAKDRSFEFDFQGTFTNINPYINYEYQLDDLRLVKITLQETNQGTLVTEIFDPEQENTRELQQQGWQAILVQFKKFIEAGD